MSGKGGGMYTLREEDEVEEEILDQKCQELFALCDGERKGFITKADLHGLEGELLSKTDEVFDTLDKDKSGTLTLEEFRSGFASFLGIDKLQEDEESHFETDAKEEEQFYDLLEALGATNLFANEQSTILNMWKQLKKEDRNVMLEFESFLAHVTSELKRSQTEYSDLEMLFKNRSNVHDKELKRLLEEMEQAVEAEKRKIASEEILKERKIREDLECELQEKNGFLQELLEKQAEMEHKLRNIYSTEIETKQENSKLLQEREELEDRLALLEKTHRDLKVSLDSMRHHDIKEKRERMKSSLKVTEGIAIEREGLVKQLHILRDVNKKLLDEHDAVFLPSHDIKTESENVGISVSSPGSLELSSDVIGSTASPKYNHAAIEIQDTTTKHNPFLNNGSYDYEVEVDDSYFRAGSLPCQSILPDETSQYSYVSYSSSNSDIPKDNSQNENRLENGKSRRYDLNPFLTQSIPEFQHIPLDDYNAKPVWKVKRSWASEVEQETKQSQDQWKVKLSIVPVCNSSFRLDAQQYNSEKSSQVSDVSSNPDRIYKVVFIGDSGVGKSSFIYRFCHNDFRSTFSATIGVDFQVKSVNADGHFVALQLWDTAGQERFRSVTKQYYRKADGVIIMFDVTSETSFKNVVTWINDVKEGSDDSTVLMLIGNKTDLCLREEARVVKGRDGERLADDYGALYFETSAKLGEGIDESMMAMSIMLQRREDETIERTLRLQEPAKKKTCCKN